MQWLSGLIGALIGGGFAITGQAVAHRFAVRRADHDQLRQAGSMFLTQVQNISAVLRTVYENRDDQLDTGRLGQAQVPYRQAEIQLRWTMKVLGLDTTRLKAVEDAWMNAGERWHVAGRPEWLQLYQDTINTAHDLDEYLLAALDPARRRHLRGKRSNSIRGGTA